MLVEDGCLEAEINGDTFLVETGDSLHFDPDLRHRWIAGGGKPATILILALIPEYERGDLMSRIARLDGMPTSDLSGMDPIPAVTGSDPKSS